MSKPKTLWRGVFNYGRSVERPMYRAAYSRRQAWKLMCDELAKKHGVEPRYVYSLFDGSKQNFEIEPEIIWDEEK